MNLFPPELPTSRWPAGDREADNGLISPAREPMEILWVDEMAGPVVRPYAMTRGRTRPTRGTFDLITVIVSARVVYPGEPGFSPEHLAIMRLCERPLSVAELAAKLNLPAGTVRVLLGDLFDQGLIDVREPRSTTVLPDESVFQAVINGLQSL